MFTIILFIAGFILFIIGLVAGFWGVRTKNILLILTFALVLIGYMMMKYSIRGVPFSTPSELGGINYEIVVGIIAMVFGLGSLIFTLRTRKITILKPFASAALVILGFITVHLVMTGYMYPVAIVPLGIIDEEIEPIYITWMPFLMTIILVLIVVVLARLF